MLGPTLAFSDVFMPPVESSLFPEDVDVSTQLTPKIRLKKPFISAAMDTVTGSAMAIAMAREGCLGVIHRNLPIEEQAYQVTLVKRSQSGMIVDPVCVSPEMTLDQIESLMGRHKASGFPVVDENKSLLGLITNRDIRQEPGERLVKEVMTRAERVKTLKPGTTMEEAREFFRENKFEKAPLVDELGRVVGFYTWKDVYNQTIYPNAALDNQNRLLVGAAVGTWGNDLLPRATALVEAGVDLIIIDVKNGHHSSAIEAFQQLLKEFPEIEIVPANIVSVDGAKKLIAIGAKILKIGIGVGSICTSTDVTGVGMPQFSATLEVSDFARGQGVAVITDGGLRYPSDVAKALVAGASAIMSGRLFAGTNETPNEALTEDPGKKEYRGMGSARAQVARLSTRYLQTRVPEGIEAAVPIRGPVAGVLETLTVALRSTMVEVNAATISDLWNVCFRQYTGAGLAESHPHDVQLLDEVRRRV